MSCKFETLKSITDQDCPICFGGINQGTVVVGHSLNEKIQHVYHLNCISEWFLLGKDTCPMCKRKVTNCNEYIPSVWKRIYEMIPIICKCGILVGALCGIMHETLSNVVPEKILPLIAFSVLRLIIIDPILRDKKCSNVIKFLIKIIPVVISYRLIFNKLTPFSKKIETDIKAWGFIVVEISGFAKQLRLAKKGDVIFNTVLSEMVLITSASATLIARTSIGLISNFFTRF